MLLLLTWITGQKVQEVHRPVEKFDQRLRLCRVGRRDLLQGCHSTRVDTDLRADDERQGLLQVYVAREPQ